MKQVRLTACAVLLAATLAACGTTSIDAGRTVSLGQLEIQSNDKDLERETRRHLDAINEGGSGTTTLQLSEERDRRVVARSTHGGIDKLRLNYTLRYRLVRADRKSHEGNFRLSQTIDNDDTAHLASRKEEARFFITARRDGINSLIAELQLLDQS